jgi:hypothetical protein
MPLLSNGYIGTTAFNDSVYVNGKCSNKPSNRLKFSNKILGMYNGRNGKSHRVRIPAMNSVYALFDTIVSSPITTYTLDCRRGK